MESEAIDIAPHVDANRSYCMRDSRRVSVKPPVSSSFLRKSSR